ncbi:DUF2892 domain-containing protein [Clostridium malenominatum]|uniref:DUF2892 domain-containing protein n=1 Tax=Clostridium malenominatum TaxID=1539 RepID=A0ABN1ITW2_9CLOT
MQIDSVDIIRELLLKDTSSNGFIPSSVERVKKNTNYKDNLKIANDIITKINYYKDKDEEAIERRLNELSVEWDIERILELNASIIILVGLIFGTWINKKFFLISALAGAFLLQHSIQGWCPPVAPLRKLCIKTPYEIFTEIIALKVLNLQNKC